MKKFLILITLLTSTIALTAQGQKGMKELEGNLSYSLSNQKVIYPFDSQTDERKGERFVISPKIGWFVSQSSVLGVGVGIESEYVKIERSDFETSVSKEHLFSFSPYFRNYQKITDKLFFTTTIDFALGFGKETRDEDLKMDIFEISLNARPGLSYYLSDNWALKASFGRLYYRNTSRKVTEGLEEQQPNLKETNFGINCSMDSFSLGLGYYF